jgi:4-nitrophenyl phosphatase
MDISQGSINEGKKPDRLAAIRALLIDLDGTLYRGENLLPGAKELFAFLNANRYKYCLLTNNSTVTALQYQTKLARLGIDVDGSFILTSGNAVADYLRRASPSGGGVYVVGEGGLREAVVGSGFVLDDVSPGYVVVGLDRQFCYQKLSVACRAIRNGAILIGANSDNTFPVEDGLLPGAGALLSSIVACSGARAVVVGKPNSHLLSLAIKRLGVVKAETAVVGDRIDTDILAGKRSGMQSILVLTGVTTSEELERSRIKPDHVFQNLYGLLAALEASH